MSLQTSDNHLEHNSRPFENVHVLVVEDNIQNIVLIARLLTAMGITYYEWRGSGWQITKFAENMPQVDLILMDLHLPHADGFEALAKIKATPKLCQTPVVAVTADATQHTLNKAQEAGFDSFLGKPIDPDRFADHIKAILVGEAIWDLGLNI